MSKQKTFTRAEFESRLAIRDLPPAIRGWTNPEGRGTAVIEYRSLDHAVASARRGEDYMVPGAVEAWRTYLSDHPASAKRWHGGVQSADAWEAVVRDPGNDLRDLIVRCMTSLDSIPTPFRDQPRRRTVRGLEDGDWLDQVRMEQDMNWDRAWTDRVRVMRQRPALRVVLNGGINCNIGATELAWRGAVAMAIARKAEDAGADVEVLVAFNWEGGASDHEERNALITMPLKPFGTFADRDLLTAYCCHLASFRWFAWVLLAQNLQGNRVTGWWGSMRDIGSDGAHLNADITIDYNVTTESRAIDCLRKAAEIIARSEAK